MSTALLDIQQQIAELQSKASEIKKLEFDGALQEVVSKMTTYGITLKDIENSLGRVRKAVPTEAKSAPAKYRGPNGETWSGRGLTPRWLAALITQGAKKENFAISA